jgi:hypothetical protein
MQKDVTLKAIGDLLDRKLDEKLDERFGVEFDERFDKKLKSGVESIMTTLRKHSAMLEELLVEKRKREENKQIRDYRVENLEGWAGKVGKKLEIKFEV